MLKLQDLITQDIIKYLELQLDVLRLEPKLSKVERCTCIVVIHVSIIVEEFIYSQFTVSEETIGRELL